MSFLSHSQQYQSTTGSTCKNPKQWPSLLLHIPQDFWQKRHCSLYASSSMTAKTTRTWKDFEKTFVNIDRKINNTYSPKLSSAKVIYDDIDEKIKKNCKKNTTKSSKPRHICSGSDRAERGCSAVLLRPDDLCLKPSQHHQILITNSNWSLIMKI